ncbi:MAG: multidrug efflux SMR transporter [Beijerinckiaceae bacterium]
MAHLYMFTAILLEVLGTAALQASNQFTRTGPVVILVACYFASFFFLSLALKEIPIGIAYAIWSGCGIVLISIVGSVWFRQSLDAPALVGVGLIVAGVLVINLLSTSVTH